MPDVRSASRAWDFDARALFDDLDQTRNIGIAPPLEGGVLVDEACSLAHPHGHAQILALGDSEIDILFQDMQWRAEIESAGASRIECRAITVSEPSQSDHGGIVKTQSASHRVTVGVGRCAALS